MTLRTYNLQSSVFSRESIVTSRTGFTLIEILVTMAIVAMLLSMTLFISFDFYSSYILNSERDIAVGILERARSRALNNMYESSHGVHIDPAAYIIFRGDVYIAGAATNEVTPGNPAVLKSGFTEIVFGELTGEPNAAVTLILADGPRSKSISINNEGRINW